VQQTLAPSPYRLAAFTMGSIAAIALFVMGSWALVNDPDLTSLSRRDWPAAVLAVGCLTTLTLGYRARAAAMPATSIARSGLHGLVSAALLLTAQLMAAALIAQPVRQLSARLAPLPLAHDISLTVMATLFVALGWYAATVSARLLPAR
jgi:hypothetical protein